MNVRQMFPSLIIRQTKVSAQTATKVIMEPSFNMHLRFSAFSFITPRLPGPFLTYSTVSRPPFVGLRHTSFPPDLNLFA